MQDAAFGIESLAVAVADGGRVEAVGEFCLGFGRARSLILEDDYVGFIECVTNNGEFKVFHASVSFVGANRRPEYLLRRLPFHGVLPILRACSATTYIRWYFTYLSGFQGQRFQ